MIMASFLPQCTRHFVFITHSLIFTSDTPTPIFDLLFPLSASSLVSAYHAITPAHQHIRHHLPHRRLYIGTTRPIRSPFTTVPLLFKGGVTPASHSATLPMSCVNSFDCMS